MTRLSDISVEELRAGHDAFIKKMAQFPKKPMYHRGALMTETRHDPNWRSNLAKKSPFDDEEDMNEPKSDKIIIMRMIMMLLMTISMLAGIILLYPMAGGWSFVMCLLLLPIMTLAADSRR